MTRKKLSGFSFWVCFFFFYGAVLINMILILENKIRTFLPERLF